MKKSKKLRKRIHKLTTKDIIRYQFFITEGRRVNAHKVELKFLRGDNVVASFAVIDDAPHRQAVIRWFDHRYYTLQYGAKEAKPFNMTLAKWKTINNNYA